MTPTKNTSSKYPIKNEPEALQPKLAVLIDADNAQAAIIESLLGEIAKYGVASVKRMYGDWTRPQLGSWKRVLLDHSIQPVQQFGYTQSKNSTDSSLIIDAMDLLYTRRFDGFCLISSDSDFTRLATRIREEGLVVYGFGEKKTPQPFVSACDKFIYTEVLRRESGLRGEDNIAEGSATPIDKKDVVEILKNAVDAVSDETGWAHLAAVGININKQMPEFDPRLYNCIKLSHLVKAHADVFELRPEGNGPAKALYVRIKRTEAE